jgi:phosphinothricin acetyltransferase
MEATFAYATHDDLPAIVNIYNEAISTRLSTADLQPVSVSSKKAWFSAYNPSQRPLWIMRVDGCVVGWVGLEDFYGRPAYLHTAEISIYVANGFHRCGLGQAALNHVMGELCRLEIDTLIGFVFSHNLASQGLFKKNGFECWGHLPDVALMDGIRRSLDILGRHFIP